MRIYITGPVGSGKSTLARRIAGELGMECFHLDEVVYEADSTDIWGNRKRPIAERDAIFSGILDTENAVMEDAGRECFIRGMELADEVVLLDPPRRVRLVRILRRWIKQNLGMEECIYRPRPDVLKAMLRWSRNYDTGADGTRARAERFSGKLKVIRSERDVQKYIAALKDGQKDRN